MEQNTTSNVPDVLETYNEDTWTLYALFLVELESGDCVEVAAVVGVPGYLQSTANAAGTGKGVCSAWINDSSDWDGLSESQRDEALEILNRWAPSFTESRE